MILLLPIAVAAESLDRDEAERLARLFYTLTGRQAPEAFLDDDVQVLLDSGRSPEELEEAIRWIALKVPQAQSYTLAGLLESHLAAALGEDEELVLPPQPEGDRALAAAPRGPVFEPDPLFKQQVLERFYTGTGRSPPAPPTAEDLAAFDRLSWERWTADGMLRLADWVPENVNGAEQLSWAQVADVAVEKGYNGGPRPDGQLEVLVGVRTYPGNEPPDWRVERDPHRFDGGGTVSLVTMGALPTWLDAPVARLPGRPLRVGEISGGLDSSGLRLGHATSSSALTGELVLAPSLPGSLESHGHALDGAPAWQLQDAPQLSLGGRIAASTRQGFLGFGGALYGLQGEQALVGTALVMDEQLGPLSLVQEVGLSGRRELVDGLAVQGQTLHGELAPWLDLADGVSLYGRGRLSWTSGGLVEDGEGVSDDVYDRLRVQGVGGLVLATPTTRLGALVDLHAERWSLAWTQDSLVRDQQLLSEGAAWQLGASVGAEQQLPLLRDWWLSGGARAVLGSEGPGAELGLGTRKLVMDSVWLGGGVRGGRGLSAQLSASIPF